MLNMLTVSPGVSWSYDAGTLRVYGDALLVVEHCPPQVADTLRYLEAGEPPAVSNVDTMEVLDLLRRIGALVPRPPRRWIESAVERQVDYFAALSLDAGRAQARLEAASVVLLGVGGIGGVVLAHLVGAGVRRFTLIDHDRVRLPNFNRQQLFTVADLGRAKVEAAAYWVRQRLPAAEIRLVQRRITDVAELVPVLRGTSAVVLAADDPPGEIQEITARACAEAGTALVGASCGLRTASYGPLVPPERLESYVDTLRDARRDAPAPPAPQAMSASFGPTNTIAGAYAALRLLHWLAGLTEGADTAVTVSFAEARR